MYLLCLNLYIFRWINSYRSITWIDIFRLIMNCFHFWFKMFDIWFRFFGDNFWIFMINRLNLNIVYGIFVENLLSVWLLYIKLSYIIFFQLINGFLSLFTYEYIFYSFWTTLTFDLFIKLLLMKCFYTLRPDYVLRNIEQTYNHIFSICSIHAIY